MVICWATGCWDFNIWILGGQSTLILDWALPTQFTCGTSNFSRIIWGRNREEKNGKLSKINQVTNPQPLVPRECFGVKAFKSQSHVDLVFYSQHQHVNKCLWLNNSRMLGFLWLFASVYSFSGSSLDRIHLCYCSYSSHSRVCGKLLCGLLKADLCLTLPFSSFTDLATWNQPWWDYLHNGNRQTLQIQAFMYLLIYFG